MSALLLVRIYHGREVSAREVQGAWPETAAIFRSAGIPVAVADCSAAGSAPARCGLPLAPTELVVRLRDAGAASRSHAVTMGVAEVNNASAGVPVVATVFVDRVAGVARASGVDRRRLLGRAMAHEIGHLLLNDARHATHGLMRPLWSRVEFGRHRLSDWRFLDEEARTMKAALARRAGERVMDDGAGHLQAARRGEEEAARRDGVG